MNAWAFLPWGFHKQSFWIKWALWPMTQYASISLSFLALESSSTQVQSDLVLKTFKLLFIYVSCLNLTTLIRLQVLSEPVWSLWTHSTEHQLPLLASSSGACFQEPGLRSLWVKCLHAALCFYLVYESQNHVEVMLIFIFLKLFWYARLTYFPPKWVNKIKEMDCYIVLLPMIVVIVKDILKTKIYTTNFNKEQ